MGSWETSKPKNQRSYLAYMGPEETSKPKNQRSYLAYMGSGETVKADQLFLFWQNINSNI